MRRRDSLAAGLASALPVSGAQKVAAQRRPNILFVLAIMLTGKYAHKNGVANDLRLRESEVTVDEVLAGRDYRTGFMASGILTADRGCPASSGPTVDEYLKWAARHPEMEAG